MPRRKFDKKTSTTYALVHRPQHDPRINDEDAPSQIFTEISGPSKRNKIKNRGDLEEEFGLSNIRRNEGEAAEHGVYFDDSSYDYMQHMRDLGGAGEVTWVEASTQKPKKKEDLAEALKSISLEESDVASQGGVSLSGQSMNYGGKGKAIDKSYQSQQEIPDSIAGFQPDMDPRLREVLEALDDEAYVDDDDDIFTELAQDGGEEVEQDKWEASHLDDGDDDEGWESDDTTKPIKEYKHSPAEPVPDDGDWLASFAKSKSATLNPPKPTHAAASETASITPSLASTNNPLRRKKRKGARTSTTNYSMTSSSIARTEALSVLDDRFERYEAMYMQDTIDEADEDDMVSLASGVSNAQSVRSSVSRFSTISSSRAVEGEDGDEAPQLASASFNAMLDDFLGDARAMKAKKKGAPRSGLQELDEIRAGLGPARIASRQVKVQR